jgi:Pin2-interacting protein X1
MVADGCKWVQQNWLAAKVLSVFLQTCASNTSDVYWRMLVLSQAEHAHKLRDWTTGMVGYDAILTGLKEITRGGPSSSNDGSSSSSDEDDSSEQGRSSGYDSDSDTSGRAPAKPAAAAAAAAKQESQKKSKKAAAAAAAEEKPKKRGKKQQDSADAPAAKRAKKAARSNSSSEESGSDSDSDAEPAAAAAAAAGGISVPTTVSRVKAASHLGRYSKREKAKTVRNYSANDLAAILGLPGSAPPVANGEGAAGWAAAAAVSNPAGAGAGSSSSSSSDSGSGSSSSDSDSDSEAGGERDSSDQRLRPSTPPGSDSPPARSQQRGLGGDGKNLNLVVDEELQPVSDEPEDAAGQRVWWRSIFVRAGRTGGGAPAAAAAAGGNGKQRINISGFQEDDQTNLYMQVRQIRLLCIVWLLELALDPVWSCLLRQIWLIGSGYLTSAWLSTLTLSLPGALPAYISAVPTADKP